jgi:hypothetical protein
MLHISAAHRPVCVTCLQLAVCESGTGHSGCSLGVQNSNWREDCSTRAVGQVTLRDFSFRGYDAV